MNEIHAPDGAAFVGDAQGVKVAIAKRNAITAVQNDWAWPNRPAVSTKPTAGVNLPAVEAGGAKNGAIQAVVVEIPDAASMKTVPAPVVQFVEIVARP